MKNEEKDLKKILLEQIEKQYELNKQQTEAMCNIMNSIKTIFQCLIRGITLVAIITVASYFFSPQDFTWNIEDAENTTTTTIRGGAE